MQTLAGQGVAAETKIRDGPALTEILAEAAEGDYDLIVIGGHLRRTSSKRPKKDLTTDLLLQAKRPVMIVKGAMDR